MAGVGAGVVDGVGVVVVAVFDGVDDPVQDGPDDRGVLELVSTGTDSDVEAGKGGLVVDRCPVRGDPQIRLIASTSPCALNAKMPGPGVAAAQRYTN